ncbi:MAG: hypothetical protein ACPHJ3_20280, partial [Rubripirellula sp.]
WNPESRSAGVGAVGFQQELFKKHWQATLGCPRFRASALQGRPQEKSALQLIIKRFSAIWSFVFHGEALYSGCHVPMDQ